jgi:hypothetical protein
MTWQAHVSLLAAAALTTGALWMAMVPPFEGTDELFFYNRTRELAARPENREALFYRLAAPVVRAMSPAASAAAPEYNPAFAFVSNRRGEVNRFAHDRMVAPREHVRTLAALRAVTVVMGALTVVLIYAIARLTLADGPLAVLVACICLWIPQFSFVTATVHPEAFTRLFAAAVTLVVVAYATGRLSRAAAWLLLLLAMALVPFADRQALFLAPFVALALVAVERTWAARALAALAIVVPVAVATRLVFSQTELGTDLSPWFLVVFHPLAPFTSADPTRHWLGPGAAYYAFEFVPKLFMGFWGWMGQPSILLPAWIFALLLVATLLSLTGLLLRAGRSMPSARADEARRRRLARRLMAAGVALMCLPIVYGPALAGLNLWYGRWLFAMLGPIAIGLVVGGADLVAAVRRSPHRAALGIAVVTIVAAALWTTSPGAALRAAFNMHHYGDRARGIATLRDSIVALGVVAALIEAGAVVRSWRPRAAAVPVMCWSLAAANGALLIAFVRPLYAPLTADDYAALIARYLAAHETPRAANLYVSAVKSYPQSGALRALADQAPALLLGGSSPSARAVFWQWLARGNMLRDREALLLLANQLRQDAPDARPAAAAALDRVLADAASRPDLAEPAALVRLALSSDGADGETIRTAIVAGHGRLINSILRNGEMIVEGFTVHAAPSGGTELIVYFRVHGETANRRLWVHAYPVGAPSYLTIEPSFAPAAWTPDESMWEMFELPPGVFTTYVGEWVGNDIGRGTPLGTIP